MPACSYRYVPRWIYVLLMAALVCTPCLNAWAQPPGNRLTLVFSVEEAFVNSPVQNRDNVGLQRVAQALAKLQNRYRVYVTLLASQTDQTKLYSALNVFTAAHIPFFIDGWSSDSLAPPRPAQNPVNTPYDRAHGLTRSIPELQQLRNKYGAYFAGLRLHEVFAANLSVSLFHAGIDWYPTKSMYFPQDDFFKISTLEAFFEFANRNHMQIIFSDPWWWASGNHDLHNPAVHQQQNEADLAHVMHLYPGIASLLYGNNEPVSKKQGALDRRIDSWPSLFPQNALRYAAGFGLSDQAWLCDRIRVPETQCPADKIAEWASRAVDLGATVLEFEPYWYFFKFPRSDGSNNNFAAYPEYDQRGYATDNFNTLIEALDRVAVRGAVGGDVGRKSEGRN